MIKKQIFLLKNHIKHKKNEINLKKNKNVNVLFFLKNNFFKFNKTDSFLNLKSLKNLNLLIKINAKKK